MAAVGAFAGLIFGIAHHDAKAHVPGCHSTACDRRIHKKRAAHWCRTHSVCVWKHRWRAEEPSWRGWAHRTEGCESGHNARAVSASGTYRGSMQFDLRTWREAGGHGDPIFATIYEQRVRAIELAKRVGTGRWPVCG